MIIVTGATGAIGCEIARGAARELQGTGDVLMLACRDNERGLRLCRELSSQYAGVEVCVGHLELSDVRSVRDFAGDVADMGRRVRIVHNAGVMRRRYGEDDRGRELTLAVNYYNTRLLTELLLEGGVLERAVFTTSLTRYLYGSMRRHRMPDACHYSQLGAYALSKRLVTDYASRLHASGQCAATCADPGVVDTGMIRMERWYDSLADVLFRPLIRTPELGAGPALRALRLPSGFIYTLRGRHRLPAVKSKDCEKL